MFIYILHFSRPICPDRHTCQHYTGSCTDLAVRIQSHKSGHGARLVQVANERGISFTVARVFVAAGRDAERWLKSMKNTPSYCPVCNPSPARPRGLRELSQAEIQYHLIPF